MVGDNGAVSVSPEWVCLVPRYALPAPRHRPHWGMSQWVGCAGKGSTTSLCRDMDKEWVYEDTVGALRTACGQKLVGD